MIDFTLRKYKDLLLHLQKKGYSFITFEQYCQQKSHANNASWAIEDKWIILRHDVDLKAKNSLVTAEIEHALGVVASYYFRIVPQSNQPEIIQSIAAMGHEIGYHYEDMAIAKGNTQEAFTHFCQQLQYFRQFYPVCTICMHGAPTSQWDGRDLWKEYDYNTLGIIGEPYLDVDYSDVFYLTDTGRCWDGYKVSVRDKIPIYQDEWITKHLVYHTTNDIINAIEQGSLPPRIMITTHPQRWTNNPLVWTKELLLQTLKNAIKRILIQQRAK